MEFLTNSSITSNVNSNLEAKNVNMNVELPKKKENIGSFIVDETRDEFFQSEFDDNINEERDSADKISANKLTLSDEHQQVEQHLRQQMIHSELPNYCNSNTNEYAVEVIKHRNYFKNIQDGSSCCAFTYYENLDLMIEIYKNLTKYGGVHREVSLVQLLDSSPNDECEGIVTNKVTYEKKQSPCAHEEIDNELFSETLEVVLFEGNYITNIDSESYTTYVFHKINALNRNETTRLDHAINFETNPELLRLIIGSNYLNYKEMGRLLLLVSKFTSSLCFSNDLIWRLLLGSRFGRDNSFEMMHALNCGPQQCFRHLLKTEQRKPPEPMTFAASDYRIIINVYDENGSQIIFKVLSGENIEEFFSNGYIELKGANGLKKRCYAKYSGLFKFTATVHIVRVPDQKSICVIDQRTGLNEYSLEGNYFVFTTSLSPHASLDMIDDNAVQLLRGDRDSKGIYFNFRMKIRPVKSRDIKCPDDCNVVLFGPMVLEALHFPTGTLFKDSQNENDVIRFSEALENVYGWSDVR